MRLFSSFQIGVNNMEPLFDANYDYLFTVLVLGGELVGKSSLIQRYMEGTFSYLGDNSPTVGIDFKLKYARKNGHKILLQLWDSSGKMKYRSIITHFISRMMGVILVLDVTSTKSLAEIGEWIEVIRKYANPDVQVRICSFSIEIHLYLDISLLQRYDD